jgi:hypothetical protein
MTTLDLEFVPPHGAFVVVRNGDQTLRLRAAPSQAAALALYRSVGYEPTEPRLLGDFVSFEKRFS